MPIEIERKFLLADDSWRPCVVKSALIEQGYIPTLGGFSVRIRRSNGDAYLTIKSNDPGAERLEFEYAIPPEHAELLLTRACAAGGRIEKIRHYASWAGRDWSIDEFKGALDGLVLAEIELTHADQPFDAPPWLGVDVTDDPAYRNANLVKKTVP